MNNASPSNHHSEGEVKVIIEHYRLLIIILPRF
jgi:hypothetical protein